MGSTGENHKIIGSVAKAAEMLNLLYSRGAELSGTEIARELDISVGAAHHLLYTLKLYQLIEQDSATKKYFLGIRLGILGDRVKETQYLIGLCRSHLKELMIKTNETANLSVLKGGLVVYIAQEENSKLIRMFTETGACVDAYCSGSGKVLLSGLNEDEIMNIIDRFALKQYTRNTITDREKLIACIEKTRTSGYAIDNEEREEGVMCIAAPIFDYSGKVAAAISISGPATRFKENKKDYIKEVLDVSAKISKILTGTPEQ